MSIVTIDPKYAVGVSDIARVYGVSGSAVCNWAVRFKDYPKPLFVTSSGAVWDMRAIARWCEKHDRRKVV